MYDPNKCARCANSDTFLDEVVCKDDLLHGEAECKKFSEDKLLEYTGELGSLAGRIDAKREKLIRDSESLDVKSFEKRKQEIEELVKQAKLILEAFSNQNSVYSNVLKKEAENAIAKEN